MATPRFLDKALASHRPLIRAIRSAVRFLAAAAKLFSHAPCVLLASWSQGSAYRQFDRGRVEDWRRCSLGPAYLLLPVSVGSASLAEP
jgi:hypothetical protein